MSLLPAVLGLLALVALAGALLALVASRAAGRTLARERERLLKIIEGTDVGTWEWNLETGAIVVDERCAQIVGYTLEELGPTSLASLRRMTHRRDLARSAALMRRHAAAELPVYECELRVRHKDGRWAWVLSRGKIFSRAADGQPRLMAGTHMDISERKRAETLLRESEALNLSILNSVSAEIAVLDRDGVIIAVNEPWLRFARENSPPDGRAAAGTGVGANYLGICQPQGQTTDGADDAHAARAGIAAVLEGRLPRFCMEYPCHSPREQRWFSVTVTPLGSDGRGAVVSHANISERRRAELDLQAQNIKLDMNRQVLNAVSEAILVKGADSKIIWANRAFLDYYGMDFAQLQGLVDAPFVEPDLTQQYLRDDAQVFSSGQALDVADEQVTRFDGVVQQWHTVKSPIFDSQGQVVATVGVSRDISARLQAADELRASQALLDATGRIAGVGGWTLDIATQTVRWTDQTCRIHDVEPGYRPSLEDGIRFYAPEVQPVVERAVRASIASGAGFDLELPLTTATGRSIWVRAVAEPELVDGRTVRLIGAFKDISARRALEDELRRQSELLGSVLEHLPCGLSAYDHDLKLLASNGEHQRLLDLPAALCQRPGIGLEEVLRFSAAQGEYGDTGAEATVQSILDKARGCTAVYLSERIRPNGMTVERSVAPLPGGGIVVTHSDITARKLAERALQTQTERLRLAADSAGIGVWEYDPVRGTVDWDDICYRIYGIRRDASVTALDLWTSHLHPQDAERVLADLQAAMAGQGSFKPEFRILRADGELRHIQAAAHVVRDAAGLPVRMTGVNIDVTPQRLAEQALRDAMQAAEAANVAKSEFLANISHEIRTPMNAILGMLTLLQQTALTAHQAGYADRTERAARSLLRLLNEILDFSKSEAGKMVLDPQPFRLDELLQDVGSLMSASLGVKPVTLRLDIDPTIPQRLVGDAFRLKQVLMNLLSNAIKFTAVGEVVLSMQAARRDEAEVRLQVAVRDSGIGIAAENHERVFIGFSQADASITRRFGGTGLGLAISQQLVLLMGGRLGLDSALDHGSRFHFELTLAVADGAAPLLPVPLGWPRRASARRRLAGLRLLLVEDNADNQQVARELLEAEGAEVCLAGDGQQALAAVAQAQPPFDLVLMDLQMPVMDGFTATRMIRRERGPQVLPIVAMTANVMAVDRQACLAAGMNDHVGKPFDLDHLVHVLCRHAGRTPAGPAAPPPLPAALPAALPMVVLDAAVAAGIVIGPALQRLGARVDIYQRMLRAFVRDLASMPGRLCGHLEQAELPGAVRLLHDLKGQAATLGAVDLADEAARGEKRLAALCGPSVPADGAAAALADACRAIDAACPALQALLQRLQALPQRPADAAPAQAAVDAAAYAQDLLSLCTQLGQGDMAATDSVDALQRRHGGTQDGGLQPLADAVGALDFEHALQLCRQLLEAAQA
ncbi:PAS domain-containing protein [Rubrivivax gelatinosus]|uniref:PAS domain-containing protein n=1 Tax=Rubrivivax gelatinosus TaxID=28068 RepID=UPI0019084205|nr:PAS domain-containing protein [Rubrivivax gelatinosus]